ncbi:MAG: hypothetical protein ACLPJW_15410, partial [Rhodomicrobium sp.]
FCDTGWAPELKAEEKFFQTPPKPEPLLPVSAGAGAGFETATGFAVSPPPPRVDREEKTPDDAQPPSAKQISTTRTACTMV